MNKILRSSKMIFYGMLILPYVFMPFLIHAEDAKPKEEKITINFVDVEIPTVVKFISDMTGKNFVYDERVKGRITIVAPSKFSIDEAFNLFTSVLELKGFTIVQTGAAYKIIPSAMVKQSSTGVFSEKERLVVNETYMARLIPLAFIQTQEAIPLIQPLISRDGYISAFGSGNAVLILDTAQNIEKILNIIKLIDAEQATHPPEVVYLKYAQAETLSQILKQGISGKKAGQTRAAPAPQTMQDSSKFAADTRLNAIILFGPPEEKEDYKRFISLLDVPPPEASSRINVYYLENADASEISKILGDVTKQVSSPPAGAPVAPSAQISSEFTGRILITPDKATNSLIIMASPADYQNIVHVIKKLDRRPRQVFVEAMITEVSIDKALNLGTKWRVMASKNGEPIAIGGVGTVDTSALENILTGMAGLTAGGLGNFLTVPVTKSDGTTYDLSVPGFAVLFSLAELKDVINVLSTPHILTSDNKEAEIIVGENVPFLSKMERESTSTNQPLLQSIERKDVGITLKIKPQISEGDYVKLEIYQEISSLSSTATSEGLAITTKRSAKTSVVVKDKQTIVIGGLIQDKDTKSLSKVPFLGDIPLLGWLFKYSSKEKQKTNLLIYLTPTIVKDFSSLDEIKSKTEDKFTEGASEKIDENKK